MQYTFSSEFCEVFRRGHTHSLILCMNLLSKEIPCFERRNKSHLLDQGKKARNLFISTFKGRLVDRQFNKQIDLFRSINYIFKIAWKKAVKFHVQIRIFTSHLLTRTEFYCNLESTGVPGDYIRTGDHHLIKNCTGLV